MNSELVLNELHASKSHGRVLAGLTCAPGSYSLPVVLILLVCKEQENYPCHY